MIGINPATDSPETAHALFSHARRASSITLDIPTQACVLAHVTTTLRSDRKGASGRSGVPIDRRHAGRQREASASISRCWREAREAALRFAAARLATT